MIAITIIMWGVIEIATAIESILWGLFAIIGPFVALEEMTPNGKE